MPSFRALSIKDLCRISYIAFTLALLLTLAFSYTSITPIGEQWEDYKENSLLRQELLLEIKEQFGFGGMIHNFKNFVLRGTQKHGDKAQSKSTEIQSIIKKYRQIGGLTSAENKALDDIGSVAGRYYQAITTVRDLHNQGVPISEIDGTVKINDNPAIEGFVELKKQYQLQIKSNTEKLESGISRGIMALILGIGLCIAIVGPGIYFVLTSVRSRISEFAEKIVIVSKSNDLTMDFSNQYNDEISQASNSLGKLLNKFHQIIGTISQVSNELQSETKALSEISEMTSSASSLQQEETRNVTESIHEMAQNIESVAQSSVSAADAAKEADSGVAMSSNVQNETIKSFAGLSDEVAESGRVINELQSISGKVGDVVQVIGGIAEQTNLLALNAAIEAARAGESGRGFAVVADEVRTLAQRTKESTADIQKTMTELQERTEQAVVKMESSIEIAGRSMEQAAKSQEALDNIKKVIGRITEITEHIAIAAEQQASTANRVNGSASSITRAAEENTKNSLTVNSSVSKILGRSEELFGLVGEFKI